MSTIIATILTSIFLFLSGIHIYWASGGAWGSGSVLPTKDDTVKVMMPGVVPTLIVAFGLLGFGLVVLMNVVELGFELPSWLHKYGLWAIASIFILRAIGDFNYIGFFKKRRQTKFARNDTKYYSPLCLTIGVLAIVSELIK